MVVERSQAYHTALERLTMSDGNPKKTPEDTNEIFRVVDNSGDMEQS